MQMHKIYPLRALTTRDTSDTAIALMDAWATVADVLAFYQERIANEGYLRTATERRSILELARLIGYALRPGVASTVYLAYTLDEDKSVTPPKPTAVTIPAGARAQSVPGPWELPQSFETADDLEARSQWNTLKPRMTRPQRITRADALTRDELYFDGVATNLRINDALLLVFGPERLERVLRRVAEVVPEPETERTKVSLQIVPYLVAALVPLLLDATKALQAASRDPRLEPNDARLMALYTHAAELILENLQLGNFPPLTPEYFTHERLYRWLVGDREAIVELTAFLPRDRSDLQLRREVSRIPRPLSLPKTDWDRVIIPLLDSFVLLLNKDEEYRSALVELLTQLAEQFLPVNRLDEDALKNWLATLDQQLGPVSDGNISGWINDRWNALIDFLTSLPLPWAITEDRIQTLRVHLVALLDDKLLREAVELLLDKVITLSAPPDGGENPLNTVNLLAKKLSELLNALPLAEPTTEPLPRGVSLTSLIEPLKLPPNPQFANSLRLPRNIIQTFQGGRDVTSELLVGFAPTLDETLYQAWANAEVVTDEPELRAVYVLRLTAGLFGHNAPRTPVFNPETGQVVEMQEWIPASDEGPSVLFLDNEYSGVTAGGYLIIQKPLGQMMAREVITATSINRSEYNLNGKSTVIQLSESWRLRPRGQGNRSSFVLIRRSVIHAQSDQLKLAMEPIADDVCRTDTIELDGLIDGLQTGRWLIVSGERSDVGGTTGVKAKELVMLSGVEQAFDRALPGDKTHSFLRLAVPLAYCYKRDTVTIYGNVVKATHGETRNEVLGGGDGSKALQQFTLKQQPLTFVSAPNPSGVDSTLQARVNDVLWHETDSLAGLSPADRNFITRTDDEGKTTVIFGNGQEGARLPTGLQNVKAVYRSGIGKPGNVKAEQITLLATRPLAVKEVTNPLRASGGADKETRDQARQNAPLAVLALDRLVSTQDYADFARTFAGVGKASAVRLSDGRRQVVHVTIAGAEDISIEKSSDLYRNLVKALRDFGDPYLPLQVDVRELLALVISAKVRVMPDYLWEKVEPKIRAALLDRFSFERRDLGQDAVLGEALRAIQGVEGVAYADVDTFDVIGEDAIVEQLAGGDSLSLLRKERIPIELDRVDDSEVDPLARIRPAQLAYFKPEVPDTLILNEVPR